MNAKHLLFYFFCLQTLSVLGQSPERMSYQASIRNSENAIVSNARISLKIAVLQSNISGTSVYEEVHAPTTSPNGTVGIEIGDGSPVKGSFSLIDWSKGPYFIQTSVATDGGGPYQLVGTSQLLSVPYALHAKTAERIADDANYVLRARPISVTTSRNIDAADVGNIMECTNDATLTLIDNFVNMEIGDIINLEIHNGATLTVETAGQVMLNYKEHTKAIFKSKVGNVRFGLLRKIDTNAYIISGQ